MRKTAVIACAGMLVLTGTACLLLTFRSSSGGAESAAEGRSGAVADDTVRPDGKTPARSGSSAPSSSRAGRRAKPVLPVAGLGASSDVESEDAADAEDADGVILTTEERKLAKAIEDALDREDFGLAARCAPQALQSRVRSIRESMIDTLGWFGAKALPELTSFLADADEDLAESAFDEWSMALNDIEDDVEKIATVERAMQVLSNEDQLDDISNEYIGVDEKLAVESLLRVIEGGGSENGIAKARETYEFVTGDEFESREAAEKWLAEEYEPPEDGE